MALQIEVQSNSKQARNDLARLNKSVEGISKSTQKAADTLQTTIGLITAGVAAFTAGSVLTKTTDSYRRLEARIALTNKSLIRQEYAFRQISKIAIRTRNDQESLADLYSRIGRATKQLGVEQSTVLTVTENISKAITVSGASAEAANAAIVQLGQGLAAGALRGQELNSVMEQTPAVAGAIARGMGITIGQLRAFANEGKLTAKAVVDALEGQTDFIDSEFKRIAPTFDQAIGVLSLGAGKLVYEFDQVTGSSTRLIGFLLNTGKYLAGVARPAARSLDSVLQRIKDIPLLLQPLTDVISAVGRGITKLGRQVGSFVSGLDIFGGIVSGFEKLKDLGSLLLRGLGGAVILTGEAVNSLIDSLSSIQIDFSVITDFVSETKLLDTVVASLRGFKRDIISISSDIVGYFSRLFDSKDNPIAKGFVIDTDIIGYRIDEATGTLKDKILGMYNTLTSVDVPAILFDGLIGALQWIEDRTHFIGNITTMFGMVRDLLRDMFNSLSTEVRYVLRALLAFISPIGSAIALIVDTLVNLKLPAFDSNNLKDSLVRAFDTALAHFEGGTGTLLESLMRNIGKAITFALAGAIIAGILAIPAVLTLALGAIATILGAVLLPGLDSVLAHFETSISTVMEKVGRIVSGLLLAGLAAAFPVLSEAIEGFIVGVLANFGVVGETIGAIFRAINDALGGVPTALLSAGLVSYLMFGVKGPKFLYAALKRTITWLLAFNAAAISTTVVGWGSAIAGWAASLVTLTRALVLAAAIQGGIFLASLKATATAIWIGTVPAIKALGASLLALAATAIPAVLAGLTALMAHPVILAITAVVLGAGALGVWLFGEGDSFGDKLGNVFGSITGFFGDIITSVSGAFDGLFDYLGIGISNLGDSISGAVDNLSGGEFSFNLNPISSAYAEGVDESLMVPYAPGMEPGSNSFGSLKIPEFVVDFAQEAVNNFQGLVNDLELNIDLSNMTFFTEEQKKNLGSFAQDIKDGIKNLAGKSGAALRAGAKILADKQAAAIKGSQNVFQQFKAFTFGKGTEGDFALVSKEDIDNLQNSFKTIKALEAEQKSLNVTSERYLQINEDIAAEEQKQTAILTLNKQALDGTKLTKEQIRNLTDEELKAELDKLNVVKGQLLEYKSISKQLDGLGKIGIDLPFRDFAVLSQNAQKDLLGISARAEELSLILKQVPGTPDQQLRYDAAVLEMGELTKAAGEFNEKLQESQEFISEIRNGFQDTIAGIFKGVNDLGDVFDNILKSIADRAINNVAESITDSVFGSDENGLGAFGGFFDGIFGSKEETTEGAIGGLATAAEGAKLGLASNPMFVNVVNGFAGLTEGAKQSVGVILPGAGAPAGGEEVKEGVSEGGEEAAFSIKGVFDGFTAGFSGILSGFLGPLGGIFNSVSNLFSGLMGGSGTGGLFSFIGGFFNDGGIVPGGGPTPVIAHGGEMILNRRQQSHLFGELDRARNGQAGNQQSININITGDISRQTKKEIYSMMPTIAQGVNQQNKEQNI